MRIEIAGAQITDSVVDVLETLQTQPDLVRLYTETLDEISRMVLLDLTAIDDETDAETLNRLRTLQMIRRDLRTLASPPDADLPKNDRTQLSL